MNKKHVSRVSLTLPNFMEGLNVEIVEQTDNAVLLTDTVQNGKLFVSYNTDGRQLFSITNEVRTEPGSNPRHNNFMIWIKFLHGNNGV